jgi:4-hydroxy-3-polyprenylbenzoate decarboxylase
MSASQQPTQLPLVLGITGASGAAYAVRLLEVLLEAGRDVHLAISPSGQAVIGEELGLRIDLDRFEPDTLLGKASPALRRLDRLSYYHHKNLMAPIASGSFLTSSIHFEVFKKDARSNNE